MKSHIIFGIIYIFSIKIYCENYITHPINILIDPSNLDINNLSNEIVFHYLNKSAKILSKFINSIDNENNELTPELIRKKCKRNLSISNFDSNFPDLIIFPHISGLENNNDIFKVKICGNKPSKKVRPNLALFLIKQNVNIKTLINTPIKKYKFKLKIFKYLLDCLGLNLLFRILSNQSKDSFFKIPPYLIENSFSYNSIKKLYKLSNITFPKHNLDDLGDFFEDFWPYDSIIKDFRNIDIDIRHDMTETSFHLLSDMNYYSLSQCDILLDGKGKCHRIDQKCITKKEFDNNYYLKYGIQKSKIICYFSDKYNILNNQCGNKYGVLLNDIIDYCPLIVKEPIILENYGEYEIPEFSYFHEQEIKFLIPSEKCHPKMPRTIYFNKNYETNLLNLNDVLLTEDSKKFFISYMFLENAFNKYNNYEFIIFLKFNGLIRSYRNFSTQNLILETITEDILKENGKNIRINKYQKIFNLIGNNVFTYKDLLYKSYKKQKDIFKNDYNFIPETYLYPEDENFINEYFLNYKIDKNNLWIVKPKRGSEDFFDDVHIFNSLKNESNDFLISKYIHNPHLINDKKYYLKIYALVTGLKPLRIYLNKEGIIQLAKLNYNLDYKYINNKYVHHLIRNKKNKKNTYDFTLFNGSESNQIGYTEYKKYLEEKNIDFNAIQDKIKDIVIKTVIMGYESLLSKLEEYNLNDRNFYNVFEYHILIDENYEAYLLEVNGKPDLRIYNELDEKIKESIFADTLNIIGLIPFSHDIKQETLDEEYKNDDPIQEAVDNAFCELTRPSGDFELIFPIKSNIEKYKKFIRNKLPENEEFWKNIQIENSFYL